MERHAIRLLDPPLLVMFLVSYTIANNVLYAAGSNSYGKLGIGVNPAQLQSSQVFLAVQIDQSKQMNKIHIGQEHAFMTDSDGVLYGWGSNYYRELGHSNTSTIYNKPTPVQYFLDNSIKIKNADGGSSMSIAITVDNKVYTFGGSFNGQLGRNNSDEPFGEVSYENFLKGEIPVDVSMQSNTAYILTNKHNIYVFGNCNNGACGNSREYMYTVPTRMNLTYEDSVLEPVAFFVGADNIFFVDKWDNLYGFGLNRYGQLCVPQQTSDVIYEPQRIELPDGGIASQVVPSVQHTLIRTQSGIVYGCGYGANGEFGIPNMGSTKHPLQINTSKLGMVQEVATTRQGSLILTDRGLYSSGKDQRGELGYGGKVGETRYSFEMVATGHDMGQHIDQVVAHYDYVFVYGLSGDLDTTGWAQIFGYTLLAVFLAAIVGVGIYFCIKLVKKRKNGPADRIEQEIERGQTLTEIEEW